MALYAFSTPYHAFKETRAGAALWVLGHCAIYLLIAGMYTPITLVSLRGGWGWTLFDLVWGLAAAGIVFKVLATGRFAILSTVACVLMGWLCIIAAKPIIFLLSPGALALLAAGGALYTAGIASYHSRQVPYSHAVWHSSSSPRASATTSLSSSTCSSPPHRREPLRVASSQPGRIVRSIPSERASLVSRRDGERW